MDLKSVCSKGHPYEVRKRVGRGIGSAIKNFKDGMKDDGKS